MGSEGRIIKGGPAKSRTLFEDVKTGANLARLTQKIAFRVEQYTAVVPELVDKIRANGCCRLGEMFFFFFSTGWPM